MSLHRLIYVSDAVGDAAASLLGLVEILGISERNNRRDELTGVLLRHDGRFLQAVEGRRGDIDRLMDRLHRDPRHANLRLLSDQPVSGRLFGDWAMGRADVTPAMSALLGSDDLAGISPARAEAVLAAACQGLPVSA